MSDHYYTLKHTVSGEITEKKSRFICTLGPASCEEEAAAFIAGVKKKYYDARHNCSAFILGDRRETIRSSDDGEPSGTAGRPMTDVLLGQELSFVCAVVTRYFGGTLLGTGGLIRAYSQAVQSALSGAKLTEMIRAVRFFVRVDYGDLNMMQKVIGASGIKQLSSEYGESIGFILQVPEGKYDAAAKKITEATLGRAVIRETGRGYFEA